MLRSHLTVLETSASLYPSAPVFRIPRTDVHTGIVEEWYLITYAQFRKDVERFAKYWTRTLQGAFARSCIIGIWIGGLTYTDALHIYGLCRAGYVPQLFSIRLPNPDVVFELLQKANAVALIYASEYESKLNTCPVPAFPAVSYNQVGEIDEDLPPIPASLPDDIAFIFHTSGSTSGSPKIIPCSYRWLDSVVHKSWQVSQPKQPGRQDVTSWMGSMCHIGQSFMLIGSLQHGSCVIQPTKIPFSSDEFMDMVQRCGLNRLNQFATFLAIHLRNARYNSRLSAMLCNMEELLYSGLPLDIEEEKWAHENSVRLKNLFGSTECGAMMLSVGGPGPHVHLLRPLEGMSYGFIPIEDNAPTESGHQSNARLLELVILRDSPDCPDPSLRHADGHFHTGDLFLEPVAGSYLFRGRDDDWIKTATSLRCDTGAIERNVLDMCGKLVGACVVVGTGRPSPTLFVEPAGNIDHSKLKKDIIRKTRLFHSRRYTHERITDAKMIIVVPPMTLPRTAKGNIRRKVVEDMYRTVLDQLYGTV